MAGNEIRFGVGVDDRASKPIRDIRDAWMRLQRDGSQALTAGVAAAASLKAFNLAGQAIHEVTGFLADSVKAAIDEEAGMQRLSASLQANIPGWNGNTDAIEQNIKAREALAFSDDDLRASLGTLVAATHDVAKAQEIQATAMDLARFKGVDLQTATSALVKIEAGRYRGLADLGIQLQQGATQEEALAAVRRVAAGQAQAFANTTQGAMEAAAIAIHDLQEEIGQRFAPAVKDAANFLREDLIPVLSDAIDLAEKAAPIFQRAAEAIGLFKPGPSDEIKKEAAALGDLIKAGYDSTGALDESTRAARLAAKAYDDAHASTTGLTLAVGDMDGYLASLGKSFGSASSAEGENAQVVADLDSKYGSLGATLDALPRDIDIEIRIKQIVSTTNADVGLGALGVGVIGPQSNAGPAGNTEGSTPGSTGTLPGENSLDAQLRAQQDAARRAQQAADAARRKAEQDARELAQAQIEAGREAFDALKAAAHKYFDDLHAQNLKAIDDARKAADEQIEQQKRANLQPVTDAENRLKAIQDARTLANLQADLARAQNETGVDAATKAQDIANAQNALSDFVTQQAIDQARANADAANAALDTQKAAQDAGFDQQKADENTRYQNQVQAFDAQLAALQKYLEKNPALWADATKQVMAILKAAGVDYQAAGKANADAYLAGIRSAFGGAGTVGDASNAFATVGSVQSKVSGGTYIGGGKIGDVYLDSALVGEVLDRRQGVLAATYGPTGVSTGSTR